MNKVENLFGRQRIVYFDGALGTMLQQSGMPKGIRSDLMNIIMPHSVEAIHRQYLEAGSDIICTNTFGASAHALQGFGYTPERIIAAGLAIAKRASEGRSLVAFDMGPLGDFLEPVGSLSYGGAYEMFKEQALCAENSGADLVAIETMSDITELRAAVCAVRENTSLPVFAMMTFMENMNTYMGATVRQLAALADEYRVDAVGINCSLPPEKMFPAMAALREATALPLVMKLNAGMPESDGSYSITPAEYARQALAYRELDVKVVGACCGSNPDFIRWLRHAFETPTEL